MPVLKEINQLLRNRIRSLKETVEASKQFLANLGEARPVPAPIPVPAYTRNSAKERLLLRRFGTSAIARNHNVSLGSVRPVKAQYRPFRRSGVSSSYLQSARVGLGFVRSPGYVPSNLYKNFTRGRYYSTGTNTFQAVQHLTTSTRALLQELNAQKKRFVANSGNCSQNVARLSSMIQNDSFAEGRQLLNCVVDFKVRLPQITVPNFSFLDDDYMDVLNAELQDYQKDVAVVKKEINSIFETYGSLPVKVMKDSHELKFRIYFTNQDFLTVQNLLNDLSVTNGIISECSTLDFDGDSKSSISDYVDALSIDNTESSAHVNSVVSLPEQQAGSSAIRFEMCESASLLSGSGYSSVDYCESDNGFFPILSTNSDSLQLIPETGFPLDNSSSVVIA